MDFSYENKHDNFMNKFKYYKSNNPKPSLEQVLTLQNNNCFAEVSNVSNTNVGGDARTQILGLTDLRNWQAYTFNKHPGLIFIRNPFTSLGQRYWIQNCVKIYPRKPNKSNIDVEKNIDDWWAECHKSKECDIKLQKKMRWTTLGYHHNWDTKIYNEDYKNPFPEDLAELCDVFAMYLGYKKFKPQAAIVNYYHMGSTLSAHTDHSEANLEAPLFSFSFGQSAIFLIGGHNKSQEPSAVLLNSGDVIIMSKEARLSYHAVPKILPALSEPWNGLIKFNTTPIDVKLKYLQKQPDIKNARHAWTDFDNYMKKSRININVRQVLHENQKSLIDNI